MLDFNRQPPRSNPGQERGIMKHLWGGDIGDKFFWADDDWEPRHRDYFHSSCCPCFNEGKEPDWDWDDYIRVPLKDGAPCYY